MLRHMREVALDRCSHGLTSEPLYLVYDALVQFFLESDLYAPFRFFSDPENKYRVMLDAEGFQVRDLDSLQKRIISSFERLESTQYFETAFLIRSRIDEIEKERNR